MHSIHSVRFGSVRESIRHRDEAHFTSSICVYSIKINTRVFCPILRRITPLKLPNGSCPDGARSTDRPTGPTGPTDRDSWCVHVRPRSGRTSGTSIHPSGRASIDVTFPHTKLLDNHHARPSEQDDHGVRGLHRHQDDDDRAPRCHHRS